MVIQMKRKNIKTNNKEIYEKFNMLNFSNEIILQDVKSIQVQKIIDNINSNEKVISIERIGNYFLIRKIGPINYNMYLNE
jgi:hypothetical protein